MQKYAEVFVQKLKFY